MSRRLMILPLAMALMACRHGHDQGAGHDHGHDHGHGDAHDHGSADEDGAPTTSFTLLTQAHELFVELDVPAAGRDGSYHAHVTRLRDNAPATSGRFEVAFRDGTGAVVRSFAADGVTRPGIFTPSGPAPDSPGRYGLLFRYEADGESASWDAGILEVGAEPIEPPGQPEGDITFLKETSWKLPFRIERPILQPIARRVVVPARVEADPAATCVTSAPFAGRALWDVAGAPLRAGARVAAGQEIGRLAPAAALSSRSEQEMALRTARIESERAGRELERVADLVGRGLLPDRRLAEARAAADAASASLAAAEADAAARSGADRGAPLRACRDGVVVGVLVGHGAAVGAGDPLARIAAADEVLVTGTLRGTDADARLDASQAGVRVPGSPDVIDLVQAGGQPLPAAAIVDPATAGVGVAWRVPAAGVLTIGQAVELHVAVGDAEERLTVPVSAVVEINTRPYAFVQRTGESFERRALKLGHSDGRRVAILEGLAADDLVVTQGGFDVHVASLAGTVESHRH